MSQTDNSTNNGNGTNGPDNGPDNESGVRGYLPPEGPQNVHQVPYNFREHQGQNGAHSVGSFVIHTPEVVILTADREAQSEIERLGLDAVPDDVAQEALEALREDDTESVVSIITAWVEGQEAEEEASEDSDEEPTIPEDLGSLDYRGLQDLAQEYGILATQSAEELKVALDSIRRGEGIPDDIDEADSENEDTQ